MIWLYFCAGFILNNLTYLNKPTINTMSFEKITGRASTHTACDHIIEKGSNRGRKCGASGIPTAEGNLCYKHRLGERVVDGLVTYGCECIIEKGARTGLKCGRAAGLKNGKRICGVHVKTMAKKVATKAPIEDLNDL